jgi:hypothetical protein
MDFYAYDSLGSWTPNFKPKCDKKSTTGRSTFKPASSTVTQEAEAEINVAKLSLW